MAAHGMRQATLRSPVGGLPSLRPGGRVQQTGNRSLPQDLTARPHSVVEAFQSAADWLKVSGSPTLAADTTNYRLGSRSLSIETGISTAASIEKNTDVLLADCESIRLYVYCEDKDTAAGATLRVILSNDAELTRYFVVMQYAPEWIVGWNVLNFVRSDWDAWENPPSWSDPIVKIGIKLVPKPGARARLSLGMLTAGPIGQPAVLFTFDDCKSSIYKYAFPYMRSRNIRARSTTSVI